MGKHDKGICYSVEVVSVVFDLSLHDENLQVPPNETMELIGKAHKLFSFYSDYVIQKGDHICGDWLKIVEDQSDLNITNVKKQVLDKWRHKTLIVRWREIEQGCIRLIVLDGGSLSFT